MRSLENIMDRLPASTNAWTCKWFLTICYLSIVLVALGVVHSGTVGIFAAAIGLVSLVVAISMRRSSERCEL